MRSTNNNLLNLVYRLIASGIILFICTEVILAYIVAFFLLPSEKNMRLAKAKEPLRIGLEKTHESFMFDQAKHGQTTSITRLNNSYESLVSFKAGQLDAVLTDQLTAQYLEKTYNAKPFAFIQDEGIRKPLAERLILVAKSSKADFFEQTKDMRMVFSSHSSAIDSIIVADFLNKRTEDLNKWFSQVTRTNSDFVALNMISDDKKDIAAVSEILYKQYLEQNNKSADELRVIWYSNPISKNVIVVKNNLLKDQEDELRKYLEYEDDSRLSWYFFEESLEELKKWQFAIRGKEFASSELHYMKGSKL